MTATPSTTPHAGAPPATLALSAGFVVMWSSGFIGGRLGTATASTVTLMVWRFVIVAVALVGVAWVLRGLRGRARILSRGEMGAQALVGLCGQGIYIWANVGAIETGVGAGTAALIAALQPVTAGALAGPVLGERVSARQWVGLTVGLLGVLLVVGADLTSGHAAPWWAYTLPFAGMAALVAATLLERRTAAASTPLLDALALQTAASAALFVVLAVATGRFAPPAGHLGAFTAAVAWFIGFSTVGAYGCYWLTLRRTSVTRLSSLIYLTPPTTMLWAWLMFGDPVAPRAVLGVAVCALAVALVHRRRASTPGWSCVVVRAILGERELPAGPVHVDRVRPERVARRGRLLLAARRRAGWVRVRRAGRPDRGADRCT